MGRKDVNTITVTGQVEAEPIIIGKPCTIRTNGL